MRTQLNITTAAVGLLIASGMTVPACLADSEAQLQASSYSQSNNNSEQTRESTSSAQTENTTRAQRQNDSNSTSQAPGPVSTSAANLRERNTLQPAAPKTWGSGQSWGEAALPQEKSQVSVKSESKALPAAVRTPQMHVANFQRSNAQLASRSSYSSSRHTVIRRGINRNGRYTYIKKQIRQAETSL
jgi:hypothetical protein